MHEYPSKIARTSSFLSTYFGCMLQMGRPSVKSDINEFTVTHHTMQSLKRHLFFMNEKGKHHLALDLMAIGDALFAAFAELLTALAAPPL